MIEEHFILIQNQMLVVDDTEWLHHSLESLNFTSIDIDDALELYSDDQRVVRVAEVKRELEQNQLQNYRALMDQVTPEDGALISRALQLITWNKQHRYCGQCGQLNIRDSKEQALACKYCNLVCYPRISPCVMCLVTRGEECLLAHHQRHANSMYSTLAGFVEAGENLEQTLHREVFEEVGVTVKNIDYFSSQSWPFPHQLMVGYFAEYESGKLCLEEAEIQDAKWFHYSKLPLIPPEATLSGQLIAEFIRRQEQKKHQ